MKHIVDIPGFKLSFEATRPDDGEVTSRDLAKVALSLAIQGVAGYLVTKYDESTEQDMLESLVEIGEQAQESLQEGKDTI